VGEAIATEAGKLNVRYVIHTPTMRRPAMQTTEENVRLAMKAALENTEKLKVKSVTFPGLGTGVRGIDIKAAANHMLQELKTHINAGTSLQSVVFVGFSGKSAETFRNALKTFMVE
jgi:O-acetyl-ADP-ribose deacetylase (regulator of RNase III)